MQVDQASTSAFSNVFTIFAIIGEANKDTEVSVPLGIGDMAFPPQPMFPFIPELISYAGIPGVSPAAIQVPAFPTPWLSSPGSNPNFPITITFQGVVEVSAGVFVPTNAVIYESQ